MNFVPENELFSAYLDGELTADEQARMEQLLASSPAARQLLEELRNLSHTLQSLPTEQLLEDLSPRILREAERRMLDDAPRPLPSPRDGSVAGLDWAALMRRLFRPRVMIWSAMAVGIALMFTIHDSGRHDVAVAPRPEAAPVPAVAEAPRTTPSEPATPAEPSRSPAVPAPAQTAASPAVAPTDQHSAPGQKAASPPAAPAPAKALLAGGPAAPPTNPAPASPAKAPSAIPEAPKPAATSQPLASATQLAGQATPPKTATAPADAREPVMVRGDIRAVAFQQSLLAKLMTEQHIPQPSATVAASESGKTVRIEAVVSGIQLAALLAQMRARPEAFSSITISGPSAAESTSPPAAVAGTETRPGIAASLRVEMETANRKPKVSPKSRVVYEPDAPPPPPVESRSKSPTQPSDARPVVFLLRILDSAEPAPPAESSPTKR